MSEKDLFDEEFGDLFDDVKEVKEEPKKQAPQQAAPKEGPSQDFANVDLPTPDPSKATKNNGLEEKVAKEFVSFGAKVSAQPFKRFKASKDQKARFAILSKEVLPLKTHYVDGVGTFVCFDGKCCEIEGLPRVRYLIPIVVYTVNKQGTIVSDDLELQVLSLGDEQYEALATAISFSGRDLKDVDVVVTCSDEQYQKLTFAADASQGAAWKTYATARELVEKYKTNKSKLYTAIARIISPETYLMKKGFLTPAGASQPVQSLPASTNLEDLLDE